MGYAGPTAAPALSAKPADDSPRGIGRGESIVTLGSAPRHSVTISYRTSIRPASLVLRDNYRGLAATCGGGDSRARALELPRSPTEAKSWRCRPHLPRRLMTEHDRGESQAQPLADF